MPTRDIKAIQKDIAAKLAAYHAANDAGTLTRADDMARTDEIQALRKELSDTICIGAKPCPFCGAPPIGIVHSRGGNLFEYEIGCSKCSGHFAHEDSDGSLQPRFHAARGGVKPHHAVEIWNDGPDAWRAPAGHIDVDKLPRKKAKPAESS